MASNVHAKKGGAQLLISWGEFQWRWHGFAQVRVVKCREAGSAGDKDWAKLFEDRTVPIRGLSRTTPQPAERQLWHGERSRPSWPFHAERVAFFKSQHGLGFGAGGVFLALPHGFCSSSMVECCATRCHKYLLFWNSSYQILCWEVTLGE